MNFDIKINSITIPEIRYNHHIVNLIDQLLFIDEKMFPDQQSLNPKEVA